MNLADLKNVKIDLGSLRPGLKNERVRRALMGVGALVVAGGGYAVKHFLLAAKKTAVVTAKKAAVKVAVAGVATTAGLATGANASSPAPGAAPAAVTRDSASAPAGAPTVAKAATGARAGEATPSAAQAAAKPAATPSVPAPAPAPAKAAVASAPAMPAPVPAPSTARDTAGQVAIQRETFAYGSGGRRDPFISLLSTDELRPVMADLRLVAVIHDPSGANTVAILRDQATQQQYRVRRGAVVGRLRVVQIDVTSVTLSIEEFGQNRTEVLLLRDPNRTARTTP